MLVVALFAYAAAASGPTYHSPALIATEDVDYIQLETHRPPYQFCGVNSDCLGVGIRSSGCSNGRCVPLLDFDLTSGHSNFTVDLRATIVLPITPQSRDARLNIDPVYIRTALPPGDPGRTIDKATRNFYGEFQLWKRNSDGTYGWINRRIYYSPFFMNPVTFHRLLAGSYRVIYFEIGGGTAFFSDIVIPTEEPIGFFCLAGARHFEIASPLAAERPPGPGGQSTPPGDQDNRVLLKDMAPGTMGSVLSIYFSKTECPEPPTAENDRRFGRVRIVDPFLRFTDDPGVPTAYTSPTPLPTCADFQSVAIGTDGRALLVALLASDGSVIYLPQWNGTRIFCNETVPPVWDFIILHTDEYFLLSAYVTPAALPSFLPEDWKNSSTRIKQRAINRALRQSHSVWRYDTSPRGRNISVDLGADYSPSVYQDYRTDRPYGWVRGSHTTFGNPIEFDLNPQVSFVPRSGTSQNPLRTTDAHSSYGNFFLLGHPWNFDPYNFANLHSNTALHTARSGDMPFTGAMFLHTPVKAAGLPRVKLVTKPGDDEWYPLPNEPPPVEPIDQDWAIFTQVGQLCGVDPARLATMVGIAENLGAMFLTGYGDKNLLFATTQSVVNSLGMPTDRLPEIPYQFFFRRLLESTLLLGPVTTDDTSKCVSRAILLMMTTNGAVSNAAQDPAGGAPLGGTEPTIASVVVPHGNVAFFVDDTSIGLRPRQAGRPLILQLNGGGQYYVPDVHAGCDTSSDKTVIRCPIWGTYGFRSGPYATGDSCVRDLAFRRFTKARDRIKLWSAAVLCDVDKFMTNTTYAYECLTTPGLQTVPYVELDSGTAPIDVYSASVASSLLENTAEWTTAVPVRTVSDLAHQTRQLLPVTITLEVATVGTCVVGSDASIKDEPQAAQGSLSQPPQDAEGCSVPVYSRPTWAAPGFCDVWEDNERMSWAGDFTSGGLLSQCTEDIIDGQQVWPECQLRPFVNDFEDFTHTTSYDCWLGCESSSSGRKPQIFEQNSPQWDFTTTAVTMAQFGLSSASVNISNALSFVFLDYGDFIFRNGVPYLNITLGQLCPPIMSADDTLCFRFLRFRHINTTQTFNEPIWSVTRANLNPDQSLTLTVEFDLSATSEFYLKVEVWDTPPTITDAEFYAGSFPSSLQPVVLTIPAWYTFHRPLSVRMIPDPVVCTYNPGAVTAYTTGGIPYGSRAVMMAPSNQPDNPSGLLGVDPAAFPRTFGYLYTWTSNTTTGLFFVTSFGIDRYALEPGEVITVEACDRAHSCAILADYLYMPEVIVGNPLDRIRSRIGWSPRCCRHNATCPDSLPENTNVFRLAPVLHFTNVTGDACAVGYVYGNDPGPCIDTIAFDPTLVDSDPNLLYNQLIGNVKEWQRWDGDAAADYTMLIRYGEVGVVIPGLDAPNFPCLETFTARVWQLTQFDVSVMPVPQLAPGCPDAGACCYGTGISVRGNTPELEWPVAQLLVEGVHYKLEFDPPIVSVWAAASTPNTTFGLCPGQTYTVRVFTPLATAPDAFLTPAGDPYDRCEVVRVITLAEVGFSIAGLRTFAASCTTDTGGFRVSVAYHLAACAGAMGNDTHAAAECRLSMFLTILNSTGGIARAAALVTPLGCAACPRFNAAFVLNYPDFFNSTGLRAGLYQAVFSVGPAGGPPPALAPRNTSNAAEAVWLDIAVPSDAVGGIRLSIPREIDPLCSSPTAVHQRISTMYDDRNTGPYTFTLLGPDGGAVWRWADVDLFDTPVCNGLTPDACDARIQQYGNFSGTHGLDVPYTIPANGSYIQQGYFQLLAQSARTNCSAVVVVHVATVTPVMAQAVCTPAACPGVASGRAFGAAFGGIIIPDDERPLVQSPSAHVPLRPLYYYSWINSIGERIAITPDTPAVTADVYALTVCDYNQCCASASCAVVTDNTPIVVTLAPNQTYPIVCTDGRPDFVGADAAVMVAVIINGGRPPYSIFLNYDSVLVASTGPGGVPFARVDLTVRPSADYEYTVVDSAGCSALTTFHVRVDPRAVAPLAVTATVMVSPCTAGAPAGVVRVEWTSASVVEVLLTPAFPGPANLPYELDPSGRAAVFSGLALGTYVASVRDLYGCQASATVDLAGVSSLNITENPPTRFCTGRTGIIENKIAPLADMFFQIVNGTGPFTVELAPSHVIPEIYDERTVYYRGIHCDLVYRITVYDSVGCFVVAISLPSGSVDPILPTPTSTPVPPEPSPEYHISAIILILSAFLFCMAGWALWMILARPVEQRRAGPEP